MITTGFGYICFLLLMLAFSFWFTKKYPWKIFNVVPPIILVYVASAVLASFKFYASNDSVSAAQTMVTRQFLPIAIILLLMICDFKSIMKLGPRLLGSFALCCASVMLAFVIGYLPFKNILPDYAPQSLGILSATWTGGTQNLMAAAALMDATGVELNFAILVDTVYFSAWLGILLLTVRFKDRFNRWTNANTDSLDKVIERLQNGEEMMRPATTQEMLIVMAIGAGGTWLCTTLGNLMPQIGSLNAFGWCVLFCMILGTALSFTKLRRLPAVDTIGTLFMYLLLANLGSWADFGAIVEAPAFMLCGLLIMVLHAVIYLVAAKIFHLDAFSVWVSDMAAIGGEATAPTVAGAFEQKLAPIGIMLGLTGVLIGTYLALFVTKILEIL